MKPSISEMRENPRFLEELGVWEGWIWPLKCAHKTHKLKIEHLEAGVYYLEYEHGDFIRLKDDFALDMRLTQAWEFHCIERWLENYGAEFVRCK